MRTSIRYWLLLAALSVAACGTDASDPTLATAPDVLGAPEPGRAGGGDASADASAQLTPLTVSIAATPTLAGNAPLLVHFACNVDGAAPEELLFRWVFARPADNFKQQTKNPETDFTFYVAGDYSACCTAWRADGTGEPADACETVRVRGTAALSINNPKVDGPAEVLQGTCVDVSFAVENNGDQVVDPFELRCVLSPHQTWDEEVEGHILLQSWELEGIGDGQYQTVHLDYDAVSMCIGEDVPDGQYFLLCKVDAEDAVNEENKADNTKFATTFITVDHTLGLLPDLTVPKVEIPPTQKFPKNWGDMLQYKFTIENAGEADSEGFEYAIHLCDSGELDSDCLLLSDPSSSRIFGMDAGKSLLFTRTWPIPSGLPNGSYCVVVSLDTDGEVAETQEGNNVGASTCFEVKYVDQSGVDLALTHLKCSPQDAHWNGTLAFEMTVKNLGSAPSPVWDYEVYLSNTAAPTPTSSYPLCSSPADAECDGNTPLQPGEEVSFIKVVTIAGDMPLLDYFCIARIDHESKVAETDEGNNLAVSEKKVNITAKAYTDVWVSDVTFSPESHVVEAGGVLKVHYALGNKNVSSAAGLTVCAVLSVDDKVSASEAKSKKDIVIGQTVIPVIPPKTDYRIQGGKPCFEDGAACDCEGKDCRPFMKVQVPLALDHTVGEYHVGVVADCTSLLSSETNASNNGAVAPGTLSVVGPMGGCFEDDLEPNGTEALARLLAPGHYPGLGSCNDEDWYAVDVPEGYSVEVGVLAAPTLSLDPVPWDIDVELRNPSGQIVDTSASTAEYDHVAAYAVSEPGVWTVRVKPKKAGNQARYDLSLAVVGPYDGVEIFPQDPAATPILAFPGGALFLDWKLVSLGAVAPGPVEVAIVLSEDAEIGDIPVATVVVDDAGPAMVLHRHEKIVLPPDLPGGDYHVGVIVDAPGAIEEGDESNNTALSALVTIDATRPCVDDLEHEPNDVLEQATPLEGVDQTLLELGVCPDLDDWYAVPLPLGQRFQATVTYPYAADRGYLNLELVDPRGKAVLDLGTAKGAPQVTLPYVWEAGTYYLRVTNPKTGGKAAPYTYALQIVLSDPAPEDVCAADAFEGNNHPDDAREVGCGLKQMTLCRKDKDWLVFDLPAGVSVSLTLASAGNDLKLALYKDPTGSPAALQSGNGTLPVAAPTEPTTYWVEVAPKTPTTLPSAHEYTVFFDGLAGVDLSIDGVTAVPGEVVQGEDELVRFTVSNQCLDTVPAFTFGFYLSEDDVLDASDPLIHSAPLDTPLLGKASAEVTKKLTVPPDTAPGLHYLVVVADLDGEVAESNETNNWAAGPLEVLKVCVDDTQEPNGNPAYAAPLVPDVTLTDLQICPFDLDWYTIALDAGETLLVTATFVNQDGDLDLRLYDATGASVLAKAFETNDGEQLTFVVPATGTYLLRVNGLSGASNRYDLDVITTPAGGGGG